MLEDVWEDVLESNYEKSALPFKDGPIWANRFDNFNPNSIAFSGSRMYFGCLWRSLESFSCFTLHLEKSSFVMSIENIKLPLLAQRIVNRIGRPFGLNPFPRAFPNPLTESAGQAAEVFDEVYRHNYWGSAQSRSGVGSETTFAARYSIGLAALIRSRGFRLVFDAPCGDLNWMAPLIAEAGIDYVGGDISSLVVEDGRCRHPDLDLRVFDITKDSFPEADVWHCRDCLFHLPFEAIRRALSNFATSSIPYALITSHRARFLHRNLNVGFGGFRYSTSRGHRSCCPVPLSASRISLQARFSAVCMPMVEGADRGRACRLGRMRRDGLS